MVDTLGWDPVTSRAQAWAFAESGLDQPEDAWAPHLVLSALAAHEPERLQAWVGGLSPEARAFIAETKLD